MRSQQQFNKRQTTQFLSQLLSIFLPNRRVALLVAMLLVLGGAWATKSLFVPNPAEVQGLVVGVADGDTVTVLDGGQNQHRIRLAYIDAPEKAQPFGQRAKQALSDKVFQREVRVEVVDKDRYGREVGRIWLDETDINLSQLTDGYAWFYRQYAKQSESSGDYARYEQAEAGAKESRIGLWQDEDPTPPWDYRRAKRAS